MERAQNIEYSIYETKTMIEHEFVRSDSDITTDNCSRSSECVAQSVSPKAGRVQGISIQFHNILLFTFGVMSPR